MKRPLLLLAAVWLVLAFVAAPAWALSLYSITDLGTLGGGSSIGQGINANGIVVGYGPDTNGNDLGFVRTTGAMQPLGTFPGGTMSAARGVNLAGTIVGQAEVAPGGPYQAFYATAANPGTLNGLNNTLGGTTSSAWRINNSGTIVGQADTTSGDLHAFRSVNNTMTDLGTLGGSNSVAYGINSAGKVVGQAQTADGNYHAFVHNGGPSDHPVDIQPAGGESFASSAANAINDSGAIVGWMDTGTFADGNFEQHAFLYSGNVMHDLGNFGETASVAYDINNLGKFVGSAADVRGFIGDAATMVMTDLNSLLPANSGWTITAGRAINDAGQIVATGFNGSEYHAVLLSPSAVPEPATFVMLLTAALGGLALACWRTRRQALVASPSHHSEYPR